MRTLNLKKETLVELSTEELDQVVGGGIGVTKQNTNCFCSDFASCLPTDRCPTEDCVATLGC